MALAGLEDNLGVRAGTAGGVLCRTIEEDVVSSGGATNTRVLDDLICRLVVVIADGEDTEVNLIRERSRPVDQDSADDTVAVLC